MGSQEVTLSWEGHHRTMIKVFEKLLESSSLVDCTIVAEGRQRKAHKEVLLAFSPYFQILMEEEHEKNPIIILSGFTFQELNALIDYMYYGKVVVTEDKVENLIDAAQSLQIRGLGLQSNVSSESRSDACPRPIESSRTDHKRRRINDIEALPMEVGARIKCRNQKVSRLRLEEDPSLPLTKTKTGIISIRSFASDVSSDQTSSDLSVTNNEYEIIPSPEYVEVDECSTITCESYDGNTTVLSSSADFGMGSDYNLYDSVPLRQDSSCLPTLPPAVSLSSIMTPQGSVNFVTLSSNERSRIMNISSSGDPLTPLTATGDEFCSEMQQNVEPGAEFLSEEIREEATETIAFGRETEPKQQELNHSADFACTEESWNQYQQLESGSQQSSKNGDAAYERKSTLILAAEDQLDLSKTYVCDICKKSCRNRLHLIRHIRTHSGDGSAQSVNVVVHRNTVIVEKSFESLDCDFVSARSVDLKVHRRKHKLQKKYKCTECDFATTNSGNLRVHQRVHTGEKPFKCSECDFATAHSSHLTVHRRTHTGEKPFKCSECDFAAAQSNHLKIHRRRHH